MNRIIDDTGLTSFMLELNDRVSLDYMDQYILADNVLEWLRHNYNIGNIGWQECAYGDFRDSDNFEKVINELLSLLYFDKQNFTMATLRYEIEAITGRLIDE